MKMTAAEAARKIDAIGHALNNLRHDLSKYADFYQRQSDHHLEPCIQNKAKVLVDVDYLTEHLRMLRHACVESIHDSQAANVTLADKKDEAA